MPTPPLDRLPARDAQGLFHVVVECPRSSSLKLKFDPVLGAMTLSRPLPAGLTWPHDWGFVPGTRGPDGDPLDALVLWEHATPPGVVLACRPVALLRLDQAAKGGGRERNDRLLVVPAKAPTLAQVVDLADLSDRVRAELAQFFVASGALDGKDARALGWDGAAAAQAFLEQGLA